jgi:hypothetical protein
VQFGPGRRRSTLFPGVSRMARKNGPDSDFYAEDASLSSVHSMTLGTFTEATSMHLGHEKARGSGHGGRMIRSLIVSSGCRTTGHCAICLAASARQRRHPLVSTECASCCPRDWSMRRCACSRHCMIAGDCNMPPGLALRHCRHASRTAALPTAVLALHSASPVAGCSRGRSANVGLAGLQRNLCNAALLPPCNDHTIQGQTT